MDVVLLVIAALGAVAIAVGHLARRFVPEIVVFLALGVAIGPQWLGLINEDNLPSLELLTQVALGMVIFLIGDRLRLDDLVARRTLLIPVNLAQLLLSGTAVFFAARLAGADVQVALVLALIATETGVLTVTATVTEERAAGPATELLLSSVGVTNVATALLFGLAFPFVLASSGAAAGTASTLVIFAQLVVLSTVIGMVGGWVLVFFGRGIESSGELLMFLLVTMTGVVGAAIAVGGSVVVSTLIAGLYVANFAPWLADRLFAAVRVIEAPIYLVFFVVAGAEIHLDELAEVGLLGAAYVVARGFGKVAGALLGGAAVRAPGLGVRTGLGLLPHAGMAIALVALVVEQAPDIGGSVSAVVLGSIVVFELGGPIVARRVLRAAGEDGRAKVSARAALSEAIAGGYTFDRVLIPAGGIDVLLPRLPFLLDLVASMGAELVAVHVSRPGADASGPDDVPPVLRLVRDVAEERNIPCTVVHKESELIAQAIVATARDHDVNLVVMGEPARTSLLERAGWGMIAQRVVKDVEVPVLVYPVDPTDPSNVPGVYLRRAAATAEAEQLAAQERLIVAEHAEGFTEPVPEER